jgi:hypothetical protein
MQVLQRKEVTGGHRKFRNGELWSLYYTPGIRGTTKSRKKNWAMRVAHMENSKISKNVRGRVHFGDLDVDGGIIVKCILRDIRSCTGLMWFSVAISDVLLFSGFCTNYSI